MEVHLISALWMSAALAVPVVDDPVRTGARNPADSAVVVGAEDYLVLPDVPFAARDAAAFQDAMISTRGIPAERIQVVAQPTRERLESALDRAGKETGAGGVVWVFFAGHGAASPKTGERLLLGVDTMPDEQSFVARGLPYDEISRRAGVGGAQVLVLADTCYAGAGRTGNELIAGKRFAVPAYAAAAQGHVSEWTASGPGELAGPYEPAQHGAFTYFLLGAMRGWADGEVDGERDGRVTADEASVWVQRAMRAAQITGQVPSFQGDRGLVLSAGKLEAPLDKVVFSPVSARPAPAPAPVVAPAPAPAPAPVAAPVVVVAPAPTVPAPRPDVGERTLGQDRRFSWTTNTVTDTRTGFVWARRVLNAPDWRTAFDVTCREVEAPGDWRMPKRAELETLIGAFQGGRLPDEAFPDSPDGCYMSATVPEDYDDLKYELCGDKSEMATAHQGYGGEVLCIQAAPGEVAPSPESTTSLFELAGDEAYDARTGLTWYRRSSPETFEKLEQAQRYCARLPGGAWRVPDLLELQGLVELGHGVPTLNTEVFLGVRDSDYWTTKVDEDQVTEVSFGTGTTGSSHREYDSPVLCVK